MSERKKIIVVDDNPTVLSICKNVLKTIYDVYPTPSSAKMFLLLERIMPDLILLDVEMPEIDGYETARMLRNNSNYKNIPFIFVSARRDVKNELEGLSLGAVDYIFKPFVGELFLRRIETHLSLIEHKKELETLNATMHKIVVAKAGQISELQNAVLSIVADLVECRDDVTGGHVFRTQRYLDCLIDKLIEEELYADEIASWDLDSVIPSSQLHDLGKIGISDVVLYKPARLTPDEFEVIKKHVDIGVNAINRMEKVTNDHSFFKHAKIFAGAHHEKWNGKGYPAGLAGMDIPLEGRLMAIVDVYDALVSTRPYKKPYTAEQAQATINEGRGTHFDPQLVDMFNVVADRFEKIAKENM